MHVPSNLLPSILPEDDSCKSFLSTSIPHTSDEMEVANFLINTLNTAQTCSKLIVADNEVQNLHVNETLVIFPWGGVTSEGITLCNTCLIDNWLMIFQALVKSEKLNLNTLSDTGHIIQKALILIDNNHYADAMLSIVPTKPTVILNIINSYGSKSDYFVKHLRPYLKRKATTICNLGTCPIIGIFNYHFGKTV